MSTFQVDQCLNSREFVEACNRQGLVEVWRFPRRLQDKKDPEVLAEILPSGRTLLTADREIHWNHAAHIPQGHSGIIIIAGASPWHSITKRDVMRILAMLKDRLASWHEISLRDLIVEVTDSSVEAWRVVHGAVMRVAFVQFAQPDWQAVLLAVLKQTGSE